jgi:glyoxylase-like metal-dependent hydrolase (beta-lactamase superfamily II)
MVKRIYNYRIIQNGTFGLTLDGKVLPFQEHRCTSTIVWPEGMDICPKNSLIIDPCFTMNGLRKAKNRLQRIKRCLNDIGYSFITHQHRDHILNVPDESFNSTWEIFSKHKDKCFDGISLVSCPGHDSLLRAIKFINKSGEVWIVGDAILNEEWLIQWTYYWPNGYNRSDIVSTWRSVALIISSADLIIPGHGFPIQVTANLLEKMLTKWPKAKYANNCPEVELSLKQRLCALNK